MLTLNARSLVSAAALVATLAGASVSLAQAEVITIRSGNGSLNSADRDVGAHTGWGIGLPPAAFTAADFQAARNGGGAANIGPAQAGWAANLLGDPSARFVGTGTAANPFANAKSALYAIDFYVSHPNPAATNASLELRIAGTNRIGGGPTDAVYLNEQPIQFGSITLTPAATQTFIYSDVSSLLRPGLNTLYVNHIGDASPQIGVMFNATVRLGESSPCQPEWTGTAIPGSPASSGLGGMVYDSVRDRVVVFRSAATTRETWEFDGAGWSLRSTTGPSPRSNASMAYDPIRQRTILFGGQPTSGGGAPTDTWEWNGTTWTQVSTGGGPSARFGAAAAFDPARGRMVIAGGITLSPVAMSAETWAWDGTSWTSLGNMPSGRADAAMAYDAARSEMVLFGGYQGGGSLSETNTTFAFDGTAWRTVTPSTPPSARAGASMAFDAARGQLVLTGGLDSTVPQPGTFAFTNGQWCVLDAAATLGGRFDAGLVYDSARRRLVLFGGSTTDNNTFAYDAAAVRITQQPSPVSVTERQTVVLTVAATGPSPRSFRWRKNGVPVAAAANITGVNGTTLTITNAAQSDSGAYDVVVTGPCGSETSRAVLVDVGACYANCDGSTATPTLTPADFVCFLNRFRAGCP